MGDHNSFINLGYVGSEDGDRWDEKGHGKIVQIFIWHDTQIINSIQFQYADENGNLVLSERHGNSGGSKFEVVKLNYPAEYITWIRCQMRDHIWDMDSDLCSLRFGTNRGEYGPFGQSRQPGFYLREIAFLLGEDNQFGGFYGTADKSIVKSIGAYLKPITTLTPQVPGHMLNSAPSKGYQPTPSHHFSVQYNLDGVKGMDKAVLNYLQQPSCIARKKGVHRSELAQQLNVPETMILEAIESLESEGLIYSTIDEYHYKSTANG